MKTTIDALPDDARLWIFVTDRGLTDSEAANVRERLLAFVETWTSHARPVEGTVEVREGRFVIVAAQIPGGDVSGCGTDKLFHAVQEALGSANVFLAPSLAVVFQRDAGPVQVVDRHTFRALASAGEVNPETTVFDVTLTTLGSLREGTFTRPAFQTWLARYFVPAQA